MCTLNGAAPGPSDSEQVNEVLLRDFEQVTVGPESGQDEKSFDSTLRATAVNLNADLNGPE